MASMGRRGTLGGLWSESVFGCFSHCLFLDSFVMEVCGQVGIIHSWRESGSNVSQKLVRLRGAATWRSSWWNGEVVGRVYLLGLSRSIGGCRHQV